MPRAPSLGSKDELLLKAIVVPAKPTIQIELVSTLQRRWLVLTVIDGGESLSQKPLDQRASRKPSKLSTYGAMKKKLRPAVTREVCGTWRFYVGRSKLHCNGRRSDAWWTDQNCGGNGASFSISSATNPPYRIRGCLNTRLRIHLQTTVSDPALSTQCLRTRIARRALFILPQRTSHNSIYSVVFLLPAARFIFRGAGSVRIAFSYGVGSQGNWPWSRDLFSGLASSTGGYV